MRQLFRSFAADIIPISRNQAKLNLIWEKVLLSVDEQAGHTYYVRSTLKILRSQWILELVDPDIGEKEISDCRLILTLLPTSRITHNLKSHPYETQLAVLNKSERLSELDRYVSPAMGIRMMYRLLLSLKVTARRLLQIFKFRSVIVIISTLKIPHPLR